MMNLQEFQDTDGRRLALLKLDPALLVGFLKNMDGKRVITIKGMPKDTQVVSLWIDYPTNQVVLTLTSDEFPLVAPGSHIGQINLGVSQQEVIPWAIVDDVLTGTIEEEGPDRFRFKKDEVSTDPGFVCSRPSDFTEPITGADVGASFKEFKFSFKELADQMGLVDVHADPEFVRKHSKHLDREWDPKEWNKGFHLGQLQWLKEQFPIDHKPFLYVIPGPISEVISLFDQAGMELKRSSTDQPWNLFPLEGVIVVEDKVGNQVLIGDKKLIEAYQWPSFKGIAGSAEER